MSFREKTAWVTFVAIVVVSLMYWLHVPNPFEPHRQGWVLLALSVSLGTFVLIELIAWLVFYLRNPKETRTPKDEREQMISLKATRIGSWVFTLGTFIAVFVTLHLAGAGTVAMGMSIVAAFVLAQLARQAAIIVYHRRGA
jgi:cytochrome b561